MVLLAGLAVVLGCSSKATVVTSPVTKGTGAPTRSATSTTAAVVAHVGNTLSLKSTPESSPAQVTLVKVVDPASGADQFTTPDAGKRFVGVQLRIVLGGANAASDVFPDNDTTVFDASGQSYSSDVSSLANCQSFATPLTLSPGVPALGCVSFQAPTGTKITRVQFTPASGFASVTAQWQVP
jgi:hypothetical protein